MLEEFGYMEQVEFLQTTNILAEALNRTNEVYRNKNIVLAYNKLLYSAFSEKAWGFRKLTVMKY